MLKKILFALVAVAAFALVAFAGSDSRKAKAARCYGKICIVRRNGFPDYKVRVVNTNADLNVEIVSNFADAPGRWEIVKENGFPDYKVEFVDGCEDFTVEFVNNFPGVN